MTPAFYDPSKVSLVWVERAALVADEARKRKASPARDDRERIALFGIDVQVGFCTPGSSLFVPGAVEDTQRAIQFIYANLDRTTELVFSLDTHELHQVFHPAWWQDESGAPPPPFTPIRATDLESGKWRPRRFPEQTAAYVRALEERGKYVLTVWPYHTLLGGVSHALVPAMMECAIYHSLVRDTSAVFEIKGRHPKTENYSVLAPEVTEIKGERVGEFNDALFRRLMSHDRIYVFGQAKSHCVLSTLLDLRTKCEAVDRSLLRKVHVMVDAMSPVPPPPIEPLPPELDFPAIADRTLRELETSGMTLCKTTDGIR